MGGKNKQKAAALVHAAFSRAVEQANIASPHTNITEVRSQLTQATKKKTKCCRSHPRCSKCPAVLHKLQTQGAVALNDQALRMALIKARKW